MGADVNDQAYVLVKGRGGGKTTELLEYAVTALAEMPERYSVLIVGPHTAWLRALAYDLRRLGLDDVQACELKDLVRWRGRRYVVLVDDADGLREGIYEDALANEDVRLVTASPMPPAPQHGDADCGKPTCVVCGRDLVRWRNPPPRVQPMVRG